jgi:transposase
MSNPILPWLKSLLRVWIGCCSILELVVGDRIVECYRLGTYIVFKKINMAKLEKKSKRGKLLVANPRSCGIDVGATLMQVCIPAELDDNYNRQFGTTTKDLREIVAWLKSKNITHVAMEATGVYWIPLFVKLIEAEIETVLVNPADAKNYTARKTDVSDAEWLMTLMSYNMVKPSFQIDNLSRSLRNCTRHRSTLVSTASDWIRRMQKTLELMNVKLTEVLSDITGLSGINIIEAIISGERDPYKLASLANDRCKKSKEEIANALEGTWYEELIFILKQQYDQYKFCRQQTLDLDTMIEKCMQKLANRVIKMNGGIVKEVIKKKGKRSYHKRNKTSVEVEALSVQIWGVNLLNIDGISNITVMSLMGELGSNFTDNFKNARHFCSWCNLSPTDKITGGRIVSSRMKKRVNNVGIILRNCAQTLAQSKSVFGDYYRRMKSKGGGKYAVCATAHKLATIIYTMVKKQTEYDITKVSITDKVWLEKRIKQQEKLLERLKKQNKSLNTSA